MKGRTREILLLVTSLFFVVIASEGPLKNTSGNYRARFALTKSLIDLGTIEITKYKNFIGWDQAKINNKAYCAHNPGMSFLMLPSYLLLAKPFSLLFLSGEGKQEFLVESWLTRIPVIAFFFSLAIWIILRLGKIYFFDPKIAILLFFGTIVPMYSFSALADCLSALMQFPLLYYVFTYREKKWNNFHLSLVLICAVLLYLIKPTNVALALGFILYFLIKRERKQTLLFISSFVMFFCVQFYYNFLLDGNALSFAFNYMAPNGVEVQTFEHDFANIFEFPNLQKIYEILVSPREGFLLHNPTLILGFFLLKEMKQSLALMLGPFVIFCFFLLFNRWDSGDDYAWRNGLPLIPVFFILILTHLKNFPYKKLLPRFLAMVALYIIVHICMIFRVPIVKTRILEQESGLIYTWKELFETGYVDSLFSMSQIQNAGLIVQFFILVLFIYSVKKITN